MCCGVGMCLPAHGSQQGFTTVLHLLLLQAFDGALRGLGVADIIEREVRTAADWAGSAAQQLESGLLSSSLHCSADKLKQ